MKAIQMTGYGDSSVLKIENIAQPVPATGQVLIKIAATTINPFDMKIRSGAMKQFIPIPIPFVPGTDFSGTVEETGENVTRLKKGDKVFATTFGGTYAEYIVMDEKKVSLIPNNVSLNEAAALAVPLNTAYSVLIEGANLQAGQKVLIHGAAGAVGIALVQMAKALGAYVIGTASAKGKDLIKSLGADEAIDYKTQDFGQLVHDVDLVIDGVGGETQQKSYAVVKKGGKLISIVMPTSNEEAEKYGISAEFINSAPKLEKLAFGKKLVEENKITPHIAKVLNLEAAAEAQDLVTAGGLNGKVILQIA
ncbi:NADP-dependent oxidoreductase [Mucilaginibacter sp. SG564]|uniref:NADP-dependent oxidoreductase n=1 Tax=Mucilaginibacter sp. SG564 TaxID=2587022 RepID=UPI001555E5E6|nr:NADP-dependent oxidoreductase [Mucilaginibacter sp. SG564]NOW93594.1 NADPH:quinone reductase-like Zn-dependent oxidoreductase [Mucilaginibacter sp. SG564]